MRDFDKSGAERIEETIRTLRRNFIIVCLDVWMTFIVCLQVMSMQFILFDLVGWLVIAINFGLIFYLASWSIRTAKVALSNKKFHEEAIIKAKRKFLLHRIGAFFLTLILILFFFYLAWTGYEDATPIRQLAMTLLCFSGLGTYIAFNFFFSPEVIGKHWSRAK